ncbi:MAG: DUF3106 domain-containing protein [Betaproteobacteria bacterium]|nr:DUF3106 domain-containing protein [Betaproteobacteria bacterium]
MNRPLRVFALMLAVSFSLYFHAALHAQAPAAYKPDAPTTPWSSLNSGHQKILAPLQKDWASLPGSQQQRLIAAARRYPEMRPIQQERFQERIRTWAQLTPEQRNAARDSYKDLSRLPPEKQHELREKWQAKKAQKADTPPATEPAK